MQQSLFETSQNIIPVDGEAYFYPDLFPIDESDNCLKELTENVNWKQEPIKIFGKEMMQPRLTALYGEAGKTYSYSGISMQPHAWNDTLLMIKEKIEKIAGLQFNAALLNQYRNGQDSMGWHRDNEKELGINPVIGSVSFGAIRKFQLRNYSNKKLIRTIELSNGSFLLMKGITQHFWEHQVPKTTRDVGPRINITFRIIV
ncbi:MAG: alpha-ketoglutarate-dependent dioxygenase AlkB [Ferruginibacter sp.]